jgi:hypothetical protein
MFKAIFRELQRPSFHVYTARIQDQSLQRRQLLVFKNSGEAPYGIEGK